MGARIRNIVNKGISIGITLLKIIIRRFRIPEILFSSTGFSLLISFTLEFCLPKTATLAYSLCQTTAGLFY